MNRNNYTWGLVRGSICPLIGRTEEMSVLDKALEAVVQTGEMRSVLVVGDAGIGKTRLIQDFIIKHRSESGALIPRVYRGSARDATGGFEVFTRLMRSRFGLIEGMDANAARDQIRTQVSAVLDDRRVNDVAYFLGQFVGVEFDNSPLTRAIEDDPQQAVTLRRAVVKSFFEADAAQSPICLFFDDIDSAHDDSLELLRYLIESMSGSILVICAARPTVLVQNAAFSRHNPPRHHVLQLHPLEDSDARRMMEILLEPCIDGVASELVDAACAFARGNPLLLEQMVRIYHDKGVLDEVTDISENPKWRVELQNLHRAHLPMTMADAVTVRLSSLSPEERRLLEFAATIGTSFWTSALVALRRQSMYPPETWNIESEEDRPEIKALIRQLINRDFITLGSDPSIFGEPEYVFKQRDERDAILHKLSKDTLKDYHQTISEWLELQLPHSGVWGEEYFALLANHREKTGNLIAAGHSYLDAGDIARKTYANARASEHYVHGLTLLGDTSPARRLDALHNHGDVLQLMGRLDDALEAFREMLTIAYRLDIQRKAGAAHNRIGRLLRDTGSLDEALGYLTSAMKLFEHSNDERGVASSIDDLGKLYWLKGQYDIALTHLRDGLMRRRRLGDRRSIALSLNNLGLVLESSGEFKQALDAFEQALTIRREIGDAVGIISTLHNLAVVWQDQSRFDKALPCAEEALHVAHQIGDRNRIALVTTNIGECYYRSGNTDMGIRYLQKAESLCDELGDKLGLAEALRGLGKAYLLQGELIKARDAIGRAVELFASVRSKVHLGTALRTLGEITAAGGWGAAHTRSAKEYFTRAISIFEKSGNDVELARTLRAYARFLGTDSELSQDFEAARERDQLSLRARDIETRIGIRDRADSDIPTHPLADH